jgi:pilus assembly protein CpaB
MLRRALAAVLVATALVLAVLPPQRATTVPVLVAAVDVPAGGPLRASDLTVRDWPADLVPSGALRAPPEADGRALVGAARAGEPITDARLAGAAPLAAADGAVVPVRLADAGVSAVLAPGSRVDVVAAGERADEPVVLTTDATVQAVIGDADRTDGQLVMIAMSRAAAGRVASVSLSRPVTVTLR